MGLNPSSPNSDQYQEPINFVLPISIHCQEIRLWELIKWSSKRKCLDLLSNSLNTFLKKMYADQCGEFVCVYLTKREVNLKHSAVDKTISARTYTPATPWPVDPCSIHLLRTVWLATTCVWYSWCLKGCLAPLALAVTSISIQLVGYTMSLAVQRCMTEREGPELDHGCHCPGDAAVHMHQSMAILQSW